MKKERDSGMETLRLLAMALVILVHAFSYGNFFTAASAVGGHVRASAVLVKLATRAAVDLFVLISGYFMIRAPFELKKLYRRAGSIYLTILFYSVVLTAVFLCLGRETLIYEGAQMAPGKAVLRALFPVSSQQWYFLTDYLLLCLLAPFANLAVQKLTQKQYAVLLAVLLWIFCGWMTLTRVEPFRGWFVLYGYDGLVSGKNVIWFLVLYLLGGYVSLFGKERKRPNPAFLLLALAALLANFYLYTRLPKSFGWRDTATKYTNVFVLLFAVAVLLFFKDLHFHCRPLNRCASLTLGIYAIHEFCFVRHQIWSRLDFRAMDCTSILKNAGRLALIVLGIMLVCGAAEFLRQELFRLLAKGFKKIKKTE